MTFSSRKLFHCLKDLLPTNMKGNKKMKKILISDVTLRENGVSSETKLNFREKIEIVRQLDKINVDVIESNKIENEKTDVLFLHTIAPIVKNSIISCPVGLSEEEIDIAWNAVNKAIKPRLHVLVPTSTVQMEYVCNKKPKLALEMIDTLVKKCASLCDDVEFSALDATRSEIDFLKTAIETAINAGAKTITLCDTAGTMLPQEFGEFVKDIKTIIPENVTLGVECSDFLDMGTACSISAIINGADVVKTTSNKTSVPQTENICFVLKSKQAEMDIAYGIDITAINSTIKKITAITDTKKDTNSVLSSSLKEPDAFSEKLSNTEDIKTVSSYIKKLGYDLNEEDTKKVYDEFVKLSDKKQIGSKELDAIVASVALQVPPTYKVKSYVVNNGNIINATACIELEKNGNVIRGFSIGDGPVDAAFLAIEQITGHHYELDDFQIQSVTEGRSAVGSSIVRLRSNGKLYSGKGISTDIIGASIKAYVNALNKICYEEM